MQNDPVYFPSPNPYHSPSTPMSAYPSSTGSSGYHRHTGSTSSQGSRHGGRREYSNPAVETAVTRLLVAIKELLESLTEWSKGRITETDVSDVYVRLGNDFNAAVAAFSQCNIDMSELMSVPDDLRHILEACLSEDASQAVLDLYLPDVRKIITNLLHGLRQKQTIYRRMIERTKGSTGSSSSRSSRADHNRARTSIRDSQRESQSSLLRREREIVSEHDPPRGEEQLARVSGSLSERGGSPSQSTRARQSPGYFNQPPALPPPVPLEENNEAFVPPTTRPGNQGFTPVPVPATVARYSLTDQPVHFPTTPGTEISAGSNGPSPDRKSSQADITQAIDHEHSPLLTPEKDYITPESARAPAMESSLDALKKTEAFGRRASKRFSTYNITKIAGGRDKSGMTTLDKLTGGEDRRKNRRSAMLGATLTPGDLESLVEEIESPSAVVKSPSKSLSRTNSDGRNRADSASPSPHSKRQPRTYSPAKNAPPVPPVPETFFVPTLEVTPEQVTGTNDVQPPESSPASEKPSTSLGSESVTVFLKVGLQVKKLTLERDGLSIPSLRLHFTDKFSYNPGLENFPAIYINDPSSHIQYELEDMDDVKDKSLLSLNIEPLDQIKQHIDLQISNLTQDIKDLRTTITSSRRQSLPAQASNLTLTQSPSMPRPSENQFANIARRVARLSKLQSEDFKLTKMPSADDVLRAPTSPAPVMPQMTGNSVAMSDIATTRIVSDLKTQFDEVQNLRRDLGVIRQLYTDFMNQTKESLTTLRSQTASVRELASTKIGGARGFIDTGKATMDKRSQNILTKVEELQDMVETLKHDVLKRHVSPKSSVMTTLKADIESTAKELESLTEHIQTVKPMWKKTWEEELQNIVEEQQFLSYQEEFMNDLSEDHKALIEVFGHIEKVISLRSTTGSARARFRPPPMEEGHNGLSTVMLEVRSAAVDPERRLKAIAASEKNREKERANQADEFQAELNGFVSGKKLKLTGGAEEVERIRQKRNELAIKALYNSGSQAGPPTTQQAESPTDK